MLMPLRTAAFLVATQPDGQKNGRMEPEDLPQFAERLVVGVAKLRMKFTPFCRRAGISPNTLRALMRGEQMPEAATVAKLAAALGTTPKALTEGKHGIDPSDDRLVILNDEDLEVAQAFHHAPMPVRQEVLGALQRRGRRAGASTSAAAAEWIDRLLRLPSTQRQAIAELIAEFESDRAASTTEVEDPGPTSKRSQRKVGT